MVSLVTDEMIGSSLDWFRSRTVCVSWSSKKPHVQFEYSCTVVLLQAQSYQLLKQYFAVRQFWEYGEKGNGNQ